ncbi:disease resistance protein [Sesbania bispinosa]|nr:disease resistance protein [Sesbania bispinosa]
MSIALNKSYRFRWLLPKGEDLLLLHQKDKEYVEGIINGLQEAKLRFPTLDIKATIDAVMQQKYGQKPPMDVGEASTSDHQHKSSKEQSIDPKQQQIMMEMLWDGVADGLHEAKNNFPSLHIQKTLTDIFNKGNRGSHKFPSSIDEKGEQLMDVQEPLGSRHHESSEEQNIDPQELEIMRENLCRGMLDGLLEAQTSFPTLDIETTMIEAVKKGSRFKWLIPDSEIKIPEGEGEDLLARLKRKMYIEGVVNGLIEAKLSFPTLDIQATLTTVLSRGARKGPIEASSTVQEAEDSPTVIASSSNINPLLRTFMMMNQENYEAEARRRADELQRLYDDGIEGFQNSEEFQDLMSVIYLYGLGDGLLEAQVIILALYMDIKTSVSKEIEKKVTGEAAKEVLDWTRVKIECLDDPLLQVFMMMKQGTCESEANSKIYWKLMEEHKALRKRFEEVTIALDKDSHLLPSWKNQYDKLVEKLNTRSTLSGIEMHTNITEYEKLAATLKGRTEELRRLYDDGIEGFQNSEEFQDLMSAIYLNGLQDGLLEAQAILLALDMDMDKITPVVSMVNEEEEQATDEPVDNENLDGLIGVADIPSPSGHEVDNPNDTSNSSGSRVLSIFWIFFTYIIISCSRN